MASNAPCQGFGKVFLLIATISVVASKRIKHRLQKEHAQDNAKSVSNEPETIQDECIAVESKLPELQETDNCFDIKLGDINKTCAMFVEKHSTYFTPCKDSEWKKEGCNIGKMCNYKKPSGDAANPMDNVAKTMENMEPLLQMLGVKKKLWGMEGNTLDAEVHFENRPWDTPAVVPALCEASSPLPQHAVNAELESESDETFKELALKALEDNNFTSVFHSFDEDADALLSKSECLDFTTAIKSSFVINAREADEMVLEICSFDPEEAQLDVQVFQKKASKIMVRVLASSARAATKQSHAETNASPSKTEGALGILTELSKNVRLTANLKYHSWGGFNSENRPWPSSDSTTLGTSDTSTTTSTTTSYGAGDTTTTTSMASA